MPLSAPPNRLRADARGRTKPSPGGRRGVVLVVVLFFALMLSSTVATFLRKATIDAMIVRNREARARAEALARGGIRLATALLLDDKYRETQGEAPPMDHEHELWARANDHPLTLEDGSSVVLHIEDAGAKLNLNAVIAFSEGGNADERGVELLTRLLEKVIDEMPVPPEDKALYGDPRDLATKVVDFVDEDDVPLLGGAENEVYQRKDPPYRAPNRPLLSVDELRRVDGFDGKLVDALRPYVTVYPYAGGGGINPNTAPPHVLAVLYFDDGGVGDLRLAEEKEDRIRDILEVRQKGGLVCGDDATAPECVSIRTIFPNPIYPPPSFRSDVFVVVAEGRVGTIRRRVEAVLDRREGVQPLLLSWRVL